MIDAFRTAALLAVLGTGVLVVVVFRSARAVALIFAPLGLAALLTVGFTVYVGQPFNFANVIVIPLLFGLGVANGIHFVARARDGVAAVRFGRTSTPRAVIFSGLTTIASFGSIALSAHPGTASMGLLLTVAIAFTLAATLVVLPALMILLPPSGPRGGGG